MTRARAGAAERGDLPADAPRDRLSRSRAASSGTRPFRWRPSSALPAARSRRRASSPRGQRRTPSPPDPEQWSVVAPAPEVKAAVAARPQAAQSSAANAREARPASAPADHGTGNANVPKAPKGQKAPDASPIEAHRPPAEAPAAHRPEPPHQPIRAGPRRPPPSDAEAEAAATGGASAPRAGRAAGRASCGCAAPGRVESAAGKLQAQGKFRRGEAGRAVAPGARRAWSAAPSGRTGSEAQGKPPEGPEGKKARKGQEARRREALTGFDHEDQAAVPEARAEGVRKGPFPRVSARHDHARGVRRLCVAGVRRDLQRGQEDPEGAGIATALRLPQLPPARAVPAFRAGGRGRRVRVVPGKVLGDARLPLRGQDSDRRGPTVPPCRRRRPGPFSLSARNERPYARRASPGRPAWRRSQRCRRGACFFHQLHPPRELSSAWRPCSRRSRRPRGPVEFEIPHMLCHDQRAKAQRRFPC